MPAPEIDLYSFCGFIADADGTLIDNGESRDGIGLHNWTRYQAAVAVGQSMKLRQLTLLPVEVHVQARTESKDNTSNSAIWWTLQQAGVVGPLEEFHPEHPATEIVTAIVDKKDEIYTDRVVKDTVPVVGSLEFFEALHELGFDGTIGNMGIGSSARRRDIDLFLEAQGFNGVFPPQHIVSKERVKEAKPHPETFATAATLMGVPELQFNQVGVFGDDPRDVESAKRAGDGMIVMGVTTLLAPDVLLASDLVYHPDFIARDFNDYGIRFGIV